MLDERALLDLRKDFLALNQTVHGYPLIYFDSAATAQKPTAVIEAEQNYYQSYCANVHRGAHYLSGVATEKYNQARERVARFINASESSEIIFTRSTTESINLVAHSLGKIHFEPGDEIILSGMEHHSNIVPWYLLAEEKKLTIHVIPVNDDGTLDQIAYQNLFSPKTKLVALTHASNTLGTINPIKEMIAIAHKHNALVMIDGAQAIHHLLVDVQNLDADFYAFSSHKMYGPTGVGVLFGKKQLLSLMPPYQGGGDMIASVSFDRITFAPLPQKFEAGTPNIAGVLGLKAALDYLDTVGLSAIHHYEQELTNHLMEGLKAIPQVKIIGAAPNRVSLASFSIDGIHPHDISSIFDRYGIAIRAGHLCTQPLMKRFNVTALSRASLAFYNTHDEIERFLQTFKKVFEVFSL